MARLGWLGVGLLTLACLPVTADAQEAVRDSVVIAGKRVPLPPGEWVRLAEGSGSVEGDQPGAYGAIRAVMLAQLRNGQVDGLALLSTNELPVDGGWGVPEACEAAGYVTAVRISARNLACGFADLLPANAAALTALPAWQAGLAEATKRGLSPPAALAVAGARVADRRDVIEARYAFPPARFGMSGTPSQVAAGSPLAEWTRVTEARLEAAFVTPSPAMPPLPPASPAGPAAAAASGEIPAWQLGLYKLATNRILQTAISFGIGMVLTADAYASSTLALWQSATHSVVYYGNELAWEWPRTAARMDFVAEARP